MKLRGQLLTLTLATVLLPWFGWKLVQELERFLRAGQERALLASARTISQALPAEFQAGLRFGREQVLPLRVLDNAPIIDGYGTDWPEPASPLHFVSADGLLEMEISAGQLGNQLFLLCRVIDASPMRESPPTGGTAPAGSDGLGLFLRNARGLVQFRVHTAAPGPLLIDSQSEVSGQIEGYWQDTPDGYTVELALPPGAGTLFLSVGAVDHAPGPSGTQIVREAGTLAQGRPARWLAPAPPDTGLATWLSTVIPDATRAWVVDAQGWVVASTQLPATGGGRELTWAERILYRLVAGQRTELRGALPEGIARIDTPEVLVGLDGQAGTHWGQDPENAVVRHSVAVPVFLGGDVRGAVVMEASSDGLLLVTNRALGQLLLSTVLITVVLAAGLWFLATRLSRRVQRLSGAVSEAMDDAGKPRDLPLTGDRDELGQLARNNARLLRAVADYTNYLQNLAGRLSHELKTPLAITRSSLDNLASQPLDEDTARYVARAREGLDRQAAIVRAMSEASRLESAIAAAEWGEVDLAAVLRDTVEAYRSLYPGRVVDLEAPDGPMCLHCAPDLVVQALDKLVDNAISLTGDEDRVTLVLAPETGGARLEVINTGSRLPDTLQDRLFDSLVSVREKAGAAAHLGLGLHIVRLVAEAHGGEVSARNLPDEGGVAFTLRLSGKA